MNNPVDLATLAQSAKPARKQDAADGPFAIALLLAALAGWIDAMGVTQTGGVFLSFMSGNTTQMAISLAHQRWHAAGFIGVVIVLFIAGVMVGEGTEQNARRLGPALVLLMEAACLAAGAAVFRLGLAPYPLVLAMGLQNATLHRAGGISVGLTYVTGTLVQVGKALVGRDIRHAGMYAAVWASLAIGAGCGAFALSVSPVAAVAAAAAVAGLLAMSAAVRR